MLRTRYILFFQIPRLPEALLSAGNFAALGCALKNGTVHEGVVTDDDLRYFRAAFRNQYSITAALNYYRANFRPGVLLRTRKNEWLDRKIEAPTLMIWVNRILRWARNSPAACSGCSADPSSCDYSLSLVIGFSGSSPNK